jgi:transcriptional regulator with XRE-family HTH domain
MESVRRMRREKGLSQQELADLAGIGQDSISAIETGRHEPHPRTLRKLANALGVEVVDFFREPAVPLAKAPTVGRPSAIDVALDSAIRQIALEKQAMFGGQSEPMLDQHHVNEAMQRLREEHGLDGNDAEALIDFALKAARLEEENATLRDRLQEREQAHS